MEKTLMFRSASEVRLSRVLRFMIPTYLTSLFNTASGQRLYRYPQ